MRFLSFFFVLILALPIAAHAQSSRSDSLFAAGNLAYEEERYNEALLLYQQVASNRVISAPYYYNLGNVYFRLGKLGPAILAYERAKKLDPGNTQIIHSAKIAQARTQNDLAILPEPSWITAWRITVVTLGATGLFWTGFVLYLAVVLLLAHLIWFKEPLAWRRRTLMALVPVSILFLTASLLASFQSGNMDTAVVMAQEAHFLERPDPDGRIQKTIYEGLVLQLTGTVENDWHEARLPDGSTGWVDSETIQTL